MILKNLSLSRVGRLPKVGRSKVERVFSTKLYYLLKVRNNWSNSDSETYNWSHFSTTPDDLALLAEDLREQGARFLIEETPAIVISGKDDALLICMLNTTAPFEDWQPKIRNTTISGIYKSLTRDRFPKHTAVFYHPQKDENMRSLSLPIQGHYGFSIGTDYYLRWRSQNFRWHPYSSEVRRGTVGNWNLKYIYDYIAKLTESLQTTYEESEYRPLNIDPRNALVSKEI